MELIDLSKKWKKVSRVISTDSFLPCLDDEEIDFPLDLLICEEHDYFAQGGECNGYYKTLCSSFYRVLPSLNKSKKIFISFDGVCGSGELYINDLFVSALFGKAPQTVEITDFYDYSIKNTVRIKLVSCGIGGEYEGAGISGGIQLLTVANDIYIQPRGIAVVTSALEDKAHLKIYTTVTSLSKITESFALESLIFNAKGRRVSRKLKNVKLKAGKTKTFEIRARLSRNYPYSVSDPYLYGITVNVHNNGVIVENASASFGINTVKVSDKGLYINNSRVKLCGAVMSHDNGIIGKTSCIEAEKYKLSKIKALGYNAVRYVGCPTNSALEALDLLGLYAVVDIFKSWEQAGNLGGRGFREYYKGAIKDSILALRNHPSVIMYSLGDDVSESYKRGDTSLCGEIAALVRSYDNSRPLTVNICEKIPLGREYAALGGKSVAEENYAAAAIALAREKNWFSGLAAEFFKNVDVAGYSYNHQLFNDKGNAGKIMIGLATYPSKVFEAQQESDKYSNVIGDFKFSGADFIGKGLGLGIVKYKDSIYPHVSDCGDLNLIYCEKPQAVYRRILSGMRDKSLIAVVNPQSNSDGELAADLKEIIGQEYAIKNVESSWNWQRYLGKQMEIQVMSGGEVVALYLDSKLIGRKLAGKGNKHIAVFKTEYYPGRLEAISYHKGVECSRAVLETSGAPKAIKAKVSSKSIKVGELSFIELSVCDKEGRLSFCLREIEVLISGEGKLFSLNNADPRSQKVALANVCSVYDGKALLAVKGTAEGRIEVRAVSEGLNLAKAVIKVSEN